MSSEGEQLIFLAEHYWDEFLKLPALTKKDSLLVNGVPTDVVEQHYANYAGILSAVPSEIAIKASHNLWLRCLDNENKYPDSDILETIVSHAEKYLYDANSPLRNEDAYAPFAEGLSAFEGIDEAMRGKYLFDAQMCSLNKTGTRAHDFEFCDEAGRIRNLYSLDNEYILLFFSNPGCKACKYIIDMLSSSVKISDMISSGRLAVVNMYIDEDLDAWKFYMDIYPKNWYNVYDPNYVIRTDLIYNIRAIPSIYLLDKDKIVLMKDAVPENAIRYLENNAKL